MTAIFAVGYIVLTVESTVARFVDRACRCVASCGAAHGSGSPADGGPPSVKTSARKQSEKWMSSAPTVIVTMFAVAGPSLRAVGICCVMIDLLTLHSEASVPGAAPVPADAQAPVIEKL